MLKEKKQYLDLIYYAILFVTSFAFLAIFSTVSSPFTVDYSADSSIFMAMGKMFLHGKIPYVDFFDHKGPSLILLQALSQLFDDYRLGTFILELINLFIALVLIYHTAKLLVCRKLALSLCMGVIFFLSRFFNKGNTTEELSLIPLLCVLYYSCKIYFKKEAITPTIAFIIGLSFSFLFWLRINNAGSIVACCIFLFIWTLTNKDYKSLKVLLIYFILGQIPFTLIYCSYFAYHDGLYEMIYATFLFNFLYVESLFNFSSPHTWVNYLITFVLSVGSILYYIKNKKLSIFIFSIVLLILTFITTNVGPAYNHYFILASPALIFGSLLILNFFNNKYTSIAILLLSCVLVINTLYKGYLYFKITTPKEENDYLVSYNQMSNLLEMIPKEDLNKIFYYEVVTSVYPLMHLDANYKYFVFQEWHGEIDPQIYADITKIMEQEKPLWVITQKREGEGEDFLSFFQNKDFVKILNNNYHLHSISGPFMLYQLNNETGALN